MSKYSLEDAFYLVGSMVSILLMGLSGIVAARISIFGYMSTQATKQITSVCLIAALILLTSVIITFYFRNKCYRGIKFGFKHYSIIFSLRSGLIDAGICYDIGDRKVVPRIQVDFSNDLSLGGIAIRAAPQFMSKLENLNLSSLIDNFVVERRYLSDDQNWMVYEIYSPSKLQKIKFNSLEELEEFVKNTGDYELRIDGRTYADFQHMMIIGATGSGKSYTVYMLILELLLKSTKVHIFTSDPKNSSIYVLGSLIDAEHAAKDIDDIINLVHDFHAEMQKRNAQMAEYLQQRVDMDYRDCGLEPYVFIFDEYAAFTAALKTKPTDVQKVVMSELRDIVLMGRQCGCFICYIMQKSHSNDIETAIRENLTWKCVLGNAEDTTYTTTFGNADIPLRNYGVGEGVYTDAKKTPIPKTIYIPELSFDIVEAVKRLTL